MIAAITWRPGMGDPNLTGWVITIAYGAAAMLCLRGGRRQAKAEDRKRKAEISAARNPFSSDAGTKDQSRLTSAATLLTDVTVGEPPSKAGEPASPSWFSNGSSHHPARLWFIFAATLLLMGLNKQLDLQTLLLQMGREIAVAAGWYGERRRLQMVFVLLLGAGLLVALLPLIWKQRRFFQQHPLSLVGSGLLVFYVLLRAAAIDHLDEAIGLSLDHRRWLAGMELSGILCLAGASFRAARTTHAAGRGHRLMTAAQRGRAGH